MTTAFDLTRSCYNIAGVLGRRFVVVILVFAGLGGPLAATTASEGRSGPCPPRMAHIAVDGLNPFCIDRWEAQVVEIRGRRHVTHAPTTVVTNLQVKAVTRKGVTPQGYISRNEAESACKAASKRLCTGTEWEHACQGKVPTTFPYGSEYKAGYCNDEGHAPLATLYPGLGEDVYASSEAMNDPRINQAANTVAKTGSFAKCKNAFGVYDMVGNLHEWVSDMQGSLGTFRGGYYQDTRINGDGCKYRTVAHDSNYHDYSTGFRCCADAR
ncbi:MAG: formylglycine-generating enzyme family protein [Polyangiaceae bacterium]|nr:formylglycine-generating enzyme family protein [Polyangiaceae bacterium]